MPGRSPKLAYKLPVFACLAGILLSTASCSSEERTASFQLDRPDGQSTGWQIQNISQEPVSFSLMIDSVFFQDRSELAQSIQRTASSPESQVKLAWELIGKHSFNAFYSNSRGLHAPEVLLNGPGHGYCDDMAAALALLWQSIGFKARVWNLEGHVVPEALIAGKWQAYDPDLGLFFQDADKATLSVTAIAEGRARFVVQGERSFPLADFPPDAFHLDKYLTISDNAPNPWFTDSVPEISTAFQLPAGSTLTCCNENPQNSNHPLLRLHLPKGIQGSVQIPLLPCPANEKGALGFPPRNPTEGWTFNLPTTQDLNWEFHGSPMLYSVSEFVVRSRDLQKIAIKTTPLPSALQNQALNPGFSLDLERFLSFLNILKEQPGFVNPRQIPQLYEAYHKKTGSWSPENQRQFNEKFRSLLQSARIFPVHQQALQNVLDHPFYLFLAIEHFILNYPPEQLLQALMDQS